MTAELPGPGHGALADRLDLPDDGRPERLDCPYKGLMPYGESDSEFFFGREMDRDVIIANMIASRLTLLYGPSGVGKSSVLHAGVMSRMDALARESAARRHSPDVVAVSFAGWRDNPLLGLSDAIGRQLVTYHGTVAADFPRTAPVSAELLMEWTERLDIDMVLILDQFEEFFLYHEAEDVAEGFAGEWSRALRMPGLRVNFLVAIREDALARMDRFEGFVPGLFDNYLRLEHLTADGAKQAIERPVERYNSLVSAGATVRVEPALVTELIDQTRSGRVSVVQTGEGGVDREDAGERDRIETPYLQLVLTRLWAEEMAAGSQELRADTLDRFGGAQHIVRTHLDEVMAQLPPNRQQIAARVFRQLVTPSGTKIAYTCGDLAAYTGVDERELHTLLEELSSGRLRILRPVSPPVTERGGVRYEVFHDVLALAVLDWCSRYAAEAERAEAERSLIVEREAADRRAAISKRRTRRVGAIAVAMALLLVVMVVLAVVTIVSRNRIHEQKLSLAQQQLALSERKLLSDAATQLATDPAESMHLALQAWAQGHDRDAAEAVRAALGSSPLRAVLRGHQGAINSAVFSPNGAAILTAGDDGTARLWNPVTGLEQHRWTTGRQRLTGAGFSPDGRFVSASTAEGTVWVWKAVDGSIAGQLPAQGDSVVLSWAEHARRPLFLTFSGSGGAARPRVWDADNLSRPVAVIGAAESAGSGRAATGAAAPATPQSIGAELSPDGRQVVTSDMDHRLRLWNVASAGVPVAVSDTTGTRYAYLPRFKPGSASAQVIAADTAGDLVRWNPPSTAVSTLYTRIYGTVSALSFRPDGKAVLVAGDKLAEVIDLLSEREEVFRGHTDWVTSAAFSPDGLVVGTASRDGTAQVWNAWSTEKSLMQLHPQPGGATSIAFDRSGRRVVTADGNGTARVWQLSEDVEFQGGGCWQLSVDMSNDGKTAVTSNFCNDLREHDTVTAWRVPDSGPTTAGSPRGQVTVMTKVPVPNVQGAALTPDGRFLVTNSLYGESLEERDLQAADPRTPRGTFDGDGVEDLGRPAVSPDGRFVAAGGEKDDVWLWDARTRERLPSLQAAQAANYTMYRVRFSPDSRVLVAASEDGAARVWDPESGALLATYRQPTSVVDARFSADGRYIVTASPDGIARVWDREAGPSQRPRTLAAGVADLQSAAFGGLRGEWVAAGAADGAVRVWNWQTGELLGQLPRHGDLINDVAFTADGLRIISASDDGVTRIYGCETCGDVKGVIDAATQIDAAVGPD